MRKSEAAHWSVINNTASTDSKCHIDPIKRNQKKRAFSISLTSNSREKKLDKTFPTTAAQTNQSSAMQITHNPFYKNSSTKIYSVGTNL